jgi:hypothetical protein
MCEALVVSDEAWVAAVGVPHRTRRLLAANVRRERAGLRRRITIHRSHQPQRRRCQRLRVAWEQSKRASEPIH